MPELPETAVLEPVAPAAVTPPAVPQPPAKCSLGGRTRTTWTPEQARAMGHRPKLALLPPPPVAVTVATAASPAAPADEYVRLRLDRVRRQLDRIDVLVLTETDPQKLDRLASAQAKLSEQERQLADRPLPGSKRPAPAKASRASAIIAPLDGME